MDPLPASDRPVLVLLSDFIGDDFTSVGDDVSGDTDSATGVAVDLAGARATLRGPVEDFGLIGGRHNLTDVSDVADVVRAGLVAASVRPRALRWFTHRGPFTTGDATTPETFTRVRLLPPGSDGHYLPPGRDDLHVLTAHDSAALVWRYALRPAPDLLIDLMGNHYPESES